MEGGDGSIFDEASIIRILREFLGAVQWQRGDPNKWEEAGQDLWDATALEEPSRWIVEANGINMIMTLCQTAISQPNWRACELGLGILGNVACHGDLCGRLLQDAALANFVAQSALAAEDAATVGEACRLAATVLVTSRAEDPWFQNFSTESAIQCIMWIIQNVAQESVLHRAFSLLSSLLDAAQDTLPRIVNDILALQFVPLLSSAIRGRLRMLNDSSEDETSESRKRPTVARMVSVAAPCSHDVVLEALMAADTVATVPQGQAALSSQPMLVQSIVRLLAVEGHEAQVSETAICVLAQLENNVGQYLVEDIEAIDVHLKLLEEHTAQQTALSNAAWQVSVFLLEYFLPLDDREFNFRRGAARRICDAVGAVVPNENAMEVNGTLPPSAIEYCRSTLEKLQLRLQQ